MDNFKPTPASPIRHKWLRRAAWYVAWSITACILLATLFTAYTNHRVESAISRAKAAGFPSSWDALLPSRVPDADNFGAIEDFKPFVAVEEVATTSASKSPLGSNIKYLDEKGIDALKSIKALKIKGGSSNSQGAFHTSSLAALRQQAVTDNRLPLDSGNLSDSDALLKVFEAQEPLWKRLHAAKHRTHAALFIPTRPSLTATNPFLTPSMTLASIAQLKARAYIHAGHGTEAIEECLLLLKVADLRTVPTLMEHLVRITQINLLMPALFEGVSQKVWSDAQLAMLDQRLAGYNHLSALKESIKAETIFAREVRDFMQANPAGGKALFSDFQGNSKADRLLIGSFSKALCNILCIGNLESSMHLLEFLEKPSENNLRNYKGLPQTQWGPFNGMAAAGAGALEGLLKASAQGQSLLNISRTAIALERHRIKHGVLPQTLDELRPAFLPAIPLEVFDGKPLHYSVKGNGEGFLLYSTGWQGTDEGGIVNQSNPKNGNMAWETP